MRPLTRQTAFNRACISLRYRIPSCSRHSRPQGAAAAAASDTTAVSSTALVRRRQQLQFQDLLLGDMPLPPQQPLDAASPSSSSSTSRNKGRAVGFGTSSSARQQPAQRVGIQPGASCPCKSGLQYQACCQPFLSDRVHPRSGPELARARITAALTGDDAHTASAAPAAAAAAALTGDDAHLLQQQQQQQQQQQHSQVTVHTLLQGAEGPAAALCCAVTRCVVLYCANGCPGGDVEYLVASTHPDSSLALGGSRDLMRRTRSQAAAFQKSKPAVVGMAHCRGDVDGQWLALAILQATAGELKGTKAPALYVLAKRGSSSSSSSTPTRPPSQGTSSSTRSSQSADDWLYLGQTTKLPQHADADPLWQLLSLHVPELLFDNDDSNDSDSSNSLINRELYFVWGPPALHLPTAPEAAVRSAAAAAAAAAGAGAAAATAGGSEGSSDARWYLDLLQPAVEPLRARSSSGGSIAASRAGVVCMDSLIEARKQSVQRDA